MISPIVSHVDILTENASSKKAVPELNRDMLVSRSRLPSSAQRVIFNLPAVKANTDRQTIEDPRLTDHQYEALIDEVCNTLFPIWLLSRVYTKHSSRPTKLYTAPLRLTKPARQSATRCSLSANCLFSREQSCTMSWLISARAL
jgi:hypothetical protein